MNHKSRGLKVLSLALLAVAGLMAFMAAGAQASEKSWLVEGKDITANQTVEAKAHVEGNLKVEKETNLEILCSKISTEDLLLITGTTEATGKVKFETCKTWQGGKDISANCKPVEPIVAGGKALIILHSVRNYILFDPETVGGKFAVIKFKEPCALPESNNVTGTLAAECLKPSNLEAVDCKQEEAEHLLKPNEPLFPTDALLYGANKPAKLTGIANVKLATGKTWAGHV